MSKAILKKELVTFTNEQLVEVILNAYDSSKEAKAYFEFFLNPDVEALLDKKVDIISKEIGRTKRGYSRARISHIRSVIKDFASFGVGPDNVCRLMYCTIRMLTGFYAEARYTDTLINGTLKLVRDYIVYANSNRMAAEALANINAVCTSSLGTKYFRERISQAATEAVDALKM